MFFSVEKQLNVHSNMLIAFSILHRKSTDIVDDRNERKDKKPSDKQATRYRMLDKTNWTSCLADWDYFVSVHVLIFSRFRHYRMSSLQAKREERGVRNLSTTSRKKQESSFVLKSQDVLDAVTLENDQVGMMANSSVASLTIYSPARQIFSCWLNVKTINF